MHLLYFFRQWGPRVTHETVQGGPSQMEGGAAFFSTIPVPLGATISCAASLLPDPVAGLE